MVEYEGIAVAGPWTTREPKKRKSAVVVAVVAVVVDQREKTVGET